MEKDNVVILNNIRINKAENSVLVTVNPKIYPLEIVYSAAYVFIDRAYVLIDGDPEKEILVDLKLKETGNVEELGREFNNELINYAVYAVQSARTQGVRDALVHKVFETNTCEETALKKADECTSKAENAVENESYEDDSLGIAKPWTSPEKG